jgi:deazaflavin-dependent oxidoreductase (nitroreductase family)
MRILPWLMDHTGGPVLYRLGRAGRLTVVGRSSGVPRTTMCQYKARPDGSIVVGSQEGRQWPANLAAAGRCRFEARGVPARDYDATILDGPARVAAVTELAGSPDSRGAGFYSGHIFELRPTA